MEDYLKNILQIIVIKMQLLVIYNHPTHLEMRGVCPRGNLILFNDKMGHSKSIGFWEYPMNITTIDSPTHTHTYIKCIFWHYKHVWVPWVFWQWKVYHVIENLVKLWIRLTCASFYWCMMCCPSRIRRLCDKEACKIMITPSCIHVTTLAIKWT